MTRTYDRRDWLQTLAATGVAVAVAGCTSGGGGEGGDGGGGDDTPTPTESPTPGGGGDGDFVETSTVDMTDELTFEPQQIQVSAGTTVTWENVGSIGHTVTAYEDEIPEGAEYFASGGFDSQSAANDTYPEEGNIPGGESYEHTFETTGTYEYYCIPHEMSGMVGTVTVV
ncbi:MAG: plastocyanin/azurin family copper-binding protein [Haloarculaceae archaeon]